MKYCPECGQIVPAERGAKICCCDECTEIRNKRKTKESCQVKAKIARDIYEKKPTRISHIDDIMRYAKAKGESYADIQKRKTLSMAEPIGREI